MDSLHFRNFWDDLASLPNALRTQERHCCNSKCHQQTHNISITWELRNAESQAPPQNYWSRSCFLARRLVDSYVCRCVKNPGINDISSFVEDLGILEKGMTWIKEARKEQRDRRRLGTELWGTPTVQVWRKQEKPLRKMKNRGQKAENRWRDEIDVKERRNIEE